MLLTNKMTGLAKNTLSILASYCNRKKNLPLLKAGKYCFNAYCWLLGSYFNIIHLAQSCVVPLGIMGGAENDLKVSLEICRIFSLKKSRWGMRSFLIFGYFCLGFLAPNARAIDLKSELAVSSSWAPGGKLDCEFKLQPKGGLKINKEAPWVLKVLSHEGLAFKKEKFDKSALKWDPPRFDVSASLLKTDQKSGVIEYVVEAYLCNEDKLCFRDVHKGSLAWERK